jgi:hypothetical protein
MKTQKKRYHGRFPVFSNLVFFNDNDSSVIRKITLDTVDYYDNWINLRTTSVGIPHDMVSNCSDG